MIKESQLIEKILELAEYGNSDKKRLSHILVEYYNGLDEIEKGVADLVIIFICGQTIDSILNNKIEKNDVVPMAFLSDEGET